MYKKSSSRTRPNLNTKKAESWGTQKYAMPLVESEDLKDRHRYAEERNTALDKRYSIGLRNGSGGTTI